MKKFYAILVVLALVIISSVAMAEVTVSGSVDIRSLMWNNVTDFNSDVSSNADKNRTTQERIRINVDAKHENIKGRVTIENDWDVWGRFERPQGNSAIPVVATSPTATTANDAGRLKIREGWIDFVIPGAGPAHVKVGHQFLQLGNGWFFRSGKYGSDAWVVGLPGRNTIAFVDVKFQEFTNNNNDDVDAYVVLDNFKISDTKTIGAYFARLNDPQGKLFQGAAVAVGDEGNLDTVGLWFNGKLGPINLQAEVDVQMGEVKNAASTSKFKGNQVVLQANMPIDPLTINATIASGSGDDAGSTDIKNIQTALDADPHYTFVYEYFAPTACGAKNTGFCNTQALNIGASMAVTKWMTVSADYWMLTANETAPGQDDEVGSEIDIVVKLKLYDQLTWNWQFGKLLTGKFYGANVDDVDAIQGVLSYKF
jgi:hypothetical protein